MFRRSRSFARALGAAFTIAAAACGGSGTDADTPTPVENVTVASVSVTLSNTQVLTGGTTTASASVMSNKGTPLSDRPITWQSSNTAVATIAANGATAMITAVAAGSATISAVSGGVTGTSDALSIATPPDALTDLTVSPTTITSADPGVTQLITTTAKSASGAVIEYANASGNAAVATVSTTGGNPTITAVGKGATTITINAMGTGAGLTPTSLTRTVTVSVPAVATAALSLEGNGLLPNGMSKATVTLKSANGTELKNRQVTWTSSNSAVAMVSGSGAAATVTGVAPGSVTITAASEGVAVTSRTILVQPLSACVELQPDANTVALYRFDEGTGQTVANSAGNGRNGTLGTDLTTARDPLWIADGKFGSALRFTRTGDQATGQFVNVTDAAVTLNTNQMSVEMYVRPKAPYAHSNLFVAGFINFTVNINSQGGVEFGVGNGTDWHIINAETPNLNDGNWHHLVATYDGSKMRVFFDGQERLAVASAIKLANPNDFKMGGRWQNTYLNGDLDEIRVSNIARTATEVLARYCP